MFGKENNEKDPKFEVGDQVGISKYKNIYTKRYMSNWSEEIKNIVQWTYVIEDLNGKEIVGTFDQNILQ